MDLVGRKMGQNGGANFQAFMADVGAFVEANRNHPDFAADVERLGVAQEAVLSGAMNLLGWSQSDKLHLVPLSANRFLDMMSVLAVGWLLLDAGVIAAKKQAETSDTHPDHAFFEGKKASAKWFARNVLPRVEQSAKVMTFEDDTAMEIPDAAFATE